LYGTNLCYNHHKATTLDLQLVSASTTTRVNGLNRELAALQTAGVEAQEYNPSPPRTYNATDRSIKRSKAQ
jgi:hypothetical protein